MSGGLAGKTQMVAVRATGAEGSFPKGRTGLVLESWLNQAHSLDLFLAGKNNIFAEICFQTALRHCFKHFTHFHSFRSKKFVHQHRWLLLANTGTVASAVEGFGSKLRIFEQYLDLSPPQAPKSEILLISFVDV